LCILLSVFLDRLEEKKFSSSRKTNHGTPSASKLKLR